MASPAQPVAKLDRVAKLFGPLAVLRQISCELLAGHGYLLLGENGAGKSTLLRIVAGLSAPTAGHVHIHLARERIGYMAHDSMLYDELTAMENLRYYAALYAGADLLPCAEALAAVGLDESPARPVGKYSQGMRQRVSLARVLMTRPRLLLLDEPFSNMDRASALKMVEQLRQLKSAGCTLLLTTHQPELAQPLADTTWHLRGGLLAGQIGGTQ
jgi:heme ABC exporter ATP-binding subunit CcmA